MKSFNKNIDMLNAPLFKNILLFTIPIALCSIIQQLFNAADTAIVGYFDNSNALAAVGTNTETVAFIVTVSSGLSIGVNVLIAKHIGENKLDSIKQIASFSMFLAFFIGIVVFAFGQVISLPFLRLIKTPENILHLASLYLRIFFLGFPFLLVYDFGSSVLRARGNSKFPFAALVISGVINVILNLILVVVFKLGVVGVAVATAVSNVISSILIIFKLKKEKLLVLSVKKNLFNFSYANQIFKIGIPSAVSGAVFCLANIFVQAYVNKFGSVAIARSTIAMNFEYFTYYIITSFSQSTTTFVSQNYYANQFDRCKKTVRLCLFLSFLFNGGSIVIIVLFRTFFCSLFTTEQSVIQNACLRIMIILAFEPICSFYEIPAGALRGCARAHLPAISTVVGTCVFRIVWIFTVCKHYQSLEVLYYAFPLSWVITIILVSICYFAVGKRIFKRN